MVSQSAPLLDMFLRDRNDRMQLTINSTMAPVVDSSLSITACSFNSFIDVKTIKTDTQKLEALLRIWGDVFFLIGIINCA